VSAPFFFLGNRCGEQCTASGSVSRPGGLIRSSGRHLRRREPYYFSRGFGRFGPNDYLCAPMQAFMGSDAPARRPKLRT